MSRLVSSALLPPVRTGAQALQTQTPAHTSAQRSGYQVGPYDGAYPMMGRMVSYPNPHDGLGLRLFGMGLIRPFIQAINGGIRVVDFATSGVNNAFATLAGAGLVALLIKAFKDVSAIRPTVGLFALGAATYFGFKTVVKALDGRHTEYEDGDWQFRLGTTATYGVGAYCLLDLYKGTNLGAALQNGCSKAKDGLFNIPKTIVNVFKK
jgi:hypothetical protein